MLCEIEVGAKARLADRRPNPIQRLIGSQETVPLVQAKGGKVKPGTEFQSQMIPFEGIFCVLTVHPAYFFGVKMLFFYKTT